MDWYLDFVKIVVTLLSYSILFYCLFNGLFWFTSDSKEVQKVEVIKNNAT